MGDAEPCYISRFSTKLLANDLERLIAKLPPPDAPAIRPARRLPQPSIRQLRPEELATIITDYKAGATLTDIAATYGYNRVGIADALKGAGVQLRRQGLAASQVDEAERLYAAGQSLARIAERLQVNPSSVRAGLLRRGVTMRPASQPR